MSARDAPRCSHRRVRPGDSCRARGNLGATAAATDCRNLQRFSTTRLVVGIEKRRVFEGSVGGAVAPVDTVGVVGTLPLGFGTKRLGSRIKDEPALLHRLLHIHV